MPPLPAVGEGSGRAGGASNTSLWTVKGLAGGVLYKISVLSDDIEKRWGVAQPGLKKTI